MDGLAASIERSPELFPQSWHPATEMVRLIRLSEADYRRASFLDDRILTGQTVVRTVAWRQLQAAVTASQLQEKSGFIFHIGHVGSTLLSRLLGAHPRILALREPAILRTLAQRRLQDSGWEDGDDEQHLSVFLKLWSRTFRPEQWACIKATSFASELAAQILATPSAPRAIFMFTSPNSYLATIFGGPNSRQEAQILSSSRLARLHWRIGKECWSAGSLSEGEVIAMSWASEMAALMSAADVSATHVLWLNFDEFLAHPAVSLESAFRHLHIDVAPEEIHAIVSGPEMSRYSKAPEHPYDVRLRYDVLNEARREYAAEIARGLAWLNSAAAEHDIVKRAIAMSPPVQNHAVDRA